MRSHATRCRPLAALLALLTVAAPALAQTDGIVGWGQNSFGQTNPQPGRFTAVAAGAYHSLGLRADGTVAAWGNNPYGQTTVPDGLSNVVAIAAGWQHSLALKSDGTVVGWGFNGFGEATPPAGLSDVVAIAAGDDHSFALKSDGTVVGWGYNDFGVSTPPAGLSDVVALAAGVRHSLALKADGTVVMWGQSDGGQGSPPPGLTDVVGIAARDVYSLALKADGTVVGWGGNSHGQATPPPGLTDVVGIAAGWYHALALKSDGTVVGWGADGSNESSPPPGLSGVTAVAAGWSHSLALTAEAPETVEVTFSVDLTHTPLAPGQVAGLRGSISPLGWESTTALSDDDGDDVWTGTVAFDAGAAGQTLQYKFVRHGADEDPTSPELGAAGGYEGSVGPNIDGNQFSDRLLTLPSTSTVLPTVFWNNYVACSTGAPLAVTAFTLSEAFVRFANTSAVNEVDLDGCTLAVFSAQTEAVTSVTPTGGRLAAGAVTEVGAALPTGPAAFALVVGEVEPGAGVADVLGQVVAAVVYNADQTVFGRCGNDVNVFPCGSPDGRAEMDAALAALFGRATGTDDGAAAALALTVAPNPSASTARVSFGVAEAAAGRVSVFDALGREVAVLAEGSFGVGRHDLAFESGRLPAGVYVVRAAVGAEARTVRVTVAR